MFPGFASLAARKTDKNKGRKEECANPATMALRRQEAEAAN